MILPYPGQQSPMTKTKASAPLCSNETPLAPALAWLGSITEGHVGDQDFHPCQVVIKSPQPLIVEIMREAWIPSPTQE